MCYFSHLVYPIAWCHATQMDHAGSGQVLTRNSYGLRHLIQQSIHTMSALPTRDSGYQLDNGEGRVLRMYLV